MAQPITPETTSTVQAPLNTTDLNAFGLAGVVVLVDPDDAVDLGAFPEDALDVADAWASNADPVEE